MNEQVWVGGAVFEIRHDETTRVDLIIKENRSFSDALFKMLGGKSHIAKDLPTPESSIWKTYILKEKKEKKKLNPNHVLGKKKVSEPFTKTNPNTINPGKLITKKWPVLQSGIVGKRVEKDILLCSKISGRQEANNAEEQLQLF